MTGQLQRTIFWRSLAQPGCEYCELWRLPGGWRLSGTVVSAVAGEMPLAAQYEIVCDISWGTRQVQVQRSISGDVAALDLQVDRHQCWFADQEIVTVRGCFDADLSISPVTNTLPIRRCGLGIGASMEVTAAWIRFPSLEISSLRQRYTRIQSNRYSYESDTGFKTELEVDDLGLVIVYGGGWERVAQH